MSGPILISYFFFDVLIILVVARILGGIMERISQPRVVGEILAGVLLGPTLLGQELSLAIVPAEVRVVLNSFASLALAMFMFLAGVEYDLAKVRGRGSQAGLLAVLAVLIPALAGFPLARMMYTPAYTGPAVENILPFALFIGAALSVTAFPVMAHILMGRGELNSKMGSLGVASTGVMSVLMFGYISFAAAVATASGFSDFLIKGCLIVAFAAVSWWGVRPLLKRLIPGEDIGGDSMAVCFGGLLLYALIAHQLGINALIGGFLWGMILPENRVLRAKISARIKDVSMILLLPIFFAMAGFQTDLKLLSLETFPSTALFLAAAIGAKFLSALPARAFGMSWRETGTLGALFNTRGLLVLVAGLIGLQTEIISNLTFTIIVVVALVTNLMTVPLLNAFSGERGSRPVSVETGILVPVKEEDHEN
jgi:Kef-type K+ transport system membrane component KefB